MKELPYDHLLTKSYKNKKIEKNIVALLDNQQIKPQSKDLNFKKLDFVEEKVRLEVLLKNEEDLNSLKVFNKDVLVENHYKSLAQVLVPVDLIRDLSEEGYVQYIRSPVKPSLHDVTSEGVAVVEADLVQNAGYYGSGAKVAIIDMGFEGYTTNPDLPSENIVEAVSFRDDGDIEAGTDHGSACAEIVLDVAPQADLYLYNFETISELDDAVSRAISKNVDIISFSIGYEYINNFDGIGYPSVGDVCGIVDNAHSEGILFVTSTGNEAKHHYEGTFTDNDDNTYHDFEPGNEVIDLDYLYAGDPYSITLTWDDWPNSNQDYDLYLFDSSLNFIDWSEEIQDGTQPPLEWIEGYIPYDDYYYIAIAKYDASRDVHLELYGYCNDFVTYNHPGSSLSCPADAFGSMAVGATLWSDDSLEYYSSRGPTNDGRTKPDVTAPTCVTTWTDSNFCGTSASAPHVAGAAALVLSIGPSCSADDLQNIIETTALDLGVGGKDNLYGSGRVNVWNAYQSMKPIADFVYSPTNPDTSDIIQFTDTSTDADGNIVSWNWDFDDGETSTLQNPTHQYSDDGTYTVVLTVTDNHGVTNETSQQASVSNVGPTADFTYLPTNPTANEIIQFTDTSTDSDGTIVSWIWDFGDGNTSTNQNPTHSYDDDGTYTVTLTATDDNGATDETSQQISISNVAPTADFTYLPANPSTDDTIQFTDTSTDSDGTVVSWSWNFGDSDTSTSQNPTHQYSNDGTYTVTLTITDDDGATDTASEDVSVDNTPPNADFTYTPSSPSTQNAIQFTDASTDKDGTIVSWSWNFGDENTSAVQNPTHQYSDDETYTVTLTITDDDGATDSDTKYITVILAGYIFVDNDANSDWYDAAHVKTIQEAINNASVDDRIYVYNGIYCEKVNINKTINLVSEDINSVIIDGGGSGNVVNITVDWVNISGFSIINGSVGIRVFGNHTNISNNNISNNGCGIELQPYKPEGWCDFDCTHNNMIYKNIIGNNSNDGIKLRSSYNNTITKNDICYNNEGILFSWSGSNTIFYNNITNNEGIGILINCTGFIPQCGCHYNCQNNIIYNNNFLNNMIENACDYHDNNWNYLYPSGGNYWDDYAGIDANDDGIGDTPYNISGGSNQDNYPLVNPWDGTPIIGAVKNLDTGEEFPKIQQAIDDSDTLSGHTIYVKSGTYYENVTINKYGISLIGEDKNTTIIDAGGSNDVIYVSADWVKISGFMIQNCRGWWSDAGINVRSNNNTITDNFISDNGEGIFLDSSSYNTIMGNNLLNNICGIELNDFSLGSSINNTITDNKISNNNDGMQIYDSTGNSIVGNNISNNNDTGIKLYRSTNNTIKGNNISNNHNCITLWSSPSNTISDNEISSNNNGIGIGGSHNNIITGNNISNSSYGIELFYIHPGPEPSDFGYTSHNNTIIGNYMLNNNNGIYLKDSSTNNNLLYHNNLINNGQNAYDEGANTWDNGYPSGGNYWSDYTGTDSNGDMIGDTPYNISGDGNQDLYPFTNQNGWLNEPPVADANGPYDAYVNQVITFDGSGSYDTDGTITNYTWDFGDGSFGYGVNPTHTYTVVGVYNANLAVKDNYGVRSDNSTASATITEEVADTPPGGGGGPPGGGGGIPPILTINEPPVADAGGPYYGHPGENIEFDGSESNDSDGTIVNYTWDFGDGTIKYGDTTTHTYDNAGDYNITLTVTDNKGATDEGITRAIIRQLSLPPNKPVINGAITGDLNIDYNFSANSTDPDGDNIRYIFNWTDGTNLTITEYVQNGTEYNVSHNWTQAGIYIIKVYAEDISSQISGSEEWEILIDIDIKDMGLGWILDYGKDGIFDKFYPYDIGSITNVSLQDENIYLIDTDGNGEYDYIYDYMNDTYTQYGTVDPGEEETGPSGEISWIMVVGVVVAVAIIVIIVLFYRKKNASKKETSKKRKK